MHQRPSFGGTPETKLAKLSVVLLEGGDAFVAFCKRLVAFCKRRSQCVKGVAQIGIVVR